MASIDTDRAGRKRIQFKIGEDAPRKSIRLGRVSQKHAEDVRMRIERLQAGRVSGAVDEETQRWLSRLDDRIHEKIAKTGLTASRKKNTSTLKGFLDAFFAALNVKAGTKTAYGHTQRNLLNHFGPLKPVRAITPAEADQWRTSLKKYSTATASRRVGVARQMFNKAVKWDLCLRNPFADLKGGSQQNRRRLYFVPVADAQAVLASCPSTQWRLLFALCRWGGLRCPSEHVALRWADVDWERNRININSPKTGYRQIPMFPEILPHLRDAFDEAEEGAEHVITLTRTGQKNLRKAMDAIIVRAGLKPWPKPFQNLRATRETELHELYPIQTVCAWIGNSVDVAKRHYLQVMESHFEKAAQNPAQSVPLTPVPVRQTVRETVFEHVGTHVSTPERNPLGAAGFENTNKSGVKRGSVGESGAKSGAFENPLVALFRGRE